MSGSYKISLFFVCAILSFNSYAKDRLNMEHTPELATQIMNAMPNFTAGEAFQCKFAEDAIIETCEFFADCESRRQDVFDAKVGKSMMDDRFVVHDVFTWITEDRASKKPYKMSEDEETFFRATGLDPKVKLNQTFFKMVSLPKYDTDKMKADRNIFNQVMEVHKTCLSQIYFAANKVKNRNLRSHND